MQGKRILVTGASGKLGQRLVLKLHEKSGDNQIFAGIRNNGRLSDELKSKDWLQYRNLDFSDNSTFKPALDGIDCLFLQCPRSFLIDIKKHFQAFIEALKQSNVQEVVMLSVKGANKSKRIPHAKLEGLLKSSGKEFIILRSSPFMQNLNTLLLNEMLKERTISLPSKKAGFAWVDLNDVAQTAAELIRRFQVFKMHSYNITGREVLSIQESLDIINKHIDRTISYRPVSRWKFVRLKKAEGLNKQEIKNLLVLFYFPRFQKSVRPPRFHALITGHQPHTFEAFSETELAPYLNN